MGRVRDRRGWWAALLGAPVFCLTLLAAFFIFVVNNMSSAIFEC